MNSESERIKDAVWESGRIDQSRRARTFFAGQDTKLLRGILDHAAERMGKDMTHQPLLEVELKLTIGTAYRDIGLADETEAMTREARRDQYDGDPLPHRRGE